jgi:hypothetical protein
MGVMTLLAQAKIKSGICTYAYSPELRRRLHHPTRWNAIATSWEYRPSNIRGSRNSTDG